MPSELRVVCIDECLDSLSDLDRALLGTRQYFDCRQLGRDE